MNKLNSADFGFNYMNKRAGITKLSGRNLHKINADFVKSCFGQSPL